MATATKFPATFTSPVPVSTKKETRNIFDPGKALLGVSLLTCTLQVGWFASKCIHQIDVDAISYTRIAYELNDGLFHSAINAFRSPLISWLMGAFPGLPAFQSGKLITVLTYFGSVVLLYALTRKLWHSNVVAGLAAVIFAVARGVAFDAVALISPDLLFTMLTLGYFLILLDCLREDRRWFLLGCLHGVAFLAKAFALPWLGVITLSAVLASSGAKGRIRRLVAATAMPILIASSWAAILHSKYGAFTTGTQFKTNILQWTLREYPNHRPQTYATLLDISESTDAHMVGDPMPPGSWAWSYKLDLMQAFPKIFKAEKSNLPLMLKELIILSNPGVVLGFALLFGFSLRAKSGVALSKDARQIAFIVAVAAISLISAYCMLVVDARYLLPLIPLIIAVGSRFMIGTFGNRHPRLRITCWLIAVGSFAWSLAYPASPFRLQTRDFQVICYEAGAILKQNSGPNVVSIGSGPFPEHGVGWEAGYKAAYFADKRLIATHETWASRDEIKPLLNDLQKAHPSAILLWSADNVVRKELIAHLQKPYSEKSPIIDPILGDVGVVLFCEP